MKLDFIKIASVVKTHGYRGDIVLKKTENISNSLFDKCLEEGNAVFISKDGIPVPFFISPDSLYFIDDQTAQFAIDGIDNMEDAKLFIGNDIFITAENIEDLPNKGTEAIAWIDFKVEDEHEGIIGIVAGYNDDIPQNPLIIVKNQEKEILIPLNGDLIQSVDSENKKLLTKLPDGFLELF
jgi:16S rRNA processing protein RimM